MRRRARARTTLDAHTRASVCVRVYVRSMDAHSIDVPVPGSSEPARLDVPLRIFVRTYYPELQQLYAAHGVDYETVDVASSYSRGKGAAGERHGLLSLCRRGCSRDDRNVGRRDA